MQAEIALRCDSSNITLVEESPNAGDFRGGERNTEPLDRYLVITEGRGKRKKNKQGQQNTFKMNL